MSNQALAPIQIDPYLKITDVYVDVVVTHDGTGRRIPDPARIARGGVLLAILPGTARSVVPDSLTRNKLCVETVEVIRLVYGCMEQSYDGDIQHERLAREAVKLTEERRLEVVALTDKVAGLQDENARLRADLDRLRAETRIGSYRRCAGGFDDSTDGNVTSCTSTRGCGLNGCPAQK